MEVSNIFLNFASSNKNKDMDMDRNYAIAEPCYINYKGKNLLTGNEEEKETELRCYDGESQPFVGIYKGKKSLWKLTYPKMANLTEEDKSKIELSCGYIPEEGEYNAVAIALGEPQRIKKEKNNETIMAGALLALYAISPFGLQFPITTIVGCCLLVLLYN